VAVKATIRAKIEAPGSFSVPAKTLADYTALLPDGQVELELVENELVVRSGSSRTKIKGSSAEEYPVIPPVEEKHGYALSADALRNGLSQAVIAAAKNEIRPELSGVYFGFFTDRYSGLILAATDSYRLSEVRVPVEQGGDVVRCIVPARAAFEIGRLISLVQGEEREAQVRLWVNDNQLALRYGGFEMTTRLVDGKYPDYAQIIPTTFKTTASFPKDVLIKHIKAAGIFASSGVNAVSFDLNVTEKTVGVSSTSTQMGEHSSEMDADIDGQENSVLLNHKYVIEGLQHMSGEGVEFKMNGSDTPCIFQEQGHPEYLYIVMPIRQ
jgi:DNA polymerase-3 subunit beta